MITKFNPNATIVNSRVVMDEDNELRLLRTLSTGEVLSEILIPVEASKNVCLRCLSHDVSVYPSGPNRALQLICHSCNVRYGTHTIRED